MLKANSIRSTVSKSHQQIQSELVDLFTTVRNWSRSQLRGVQTEHWDVDALFQIAPDFVNLLFACSRDVASLFEDGKTLKLSLLVEAVANMYLTLYIFMNPFDFCSAETGRVCQKVYFNLQQSKYELITQTSLQKD
jgi:hypothetical protein